MAARSAPDKVTTNTDSAYVSLAQLMHCRLLAKSLNLSKQRKILSQQSGLHTSKFRGRGVDFAEVRAYQSGDDIRSIDWRVTARTGKPHTKLYAEERERPSMILLDQSQSLFFGSRVTFKSVIAAQAASLLAWAALARGDRVGGLLFSDTRQQEIRPRRSHHTVLHLLQSILKYNHALSKPTEQRPRVGLADALNHARRTIKPGSELFIISDFHVFDESSRRHLFQLSQHNDLVCIFVFDPLERELPPPGYYTVTDGTQRATLDLTQDKLRRAYTHTFEERLARLQSQLDQFKIPLVKLAGNGDLLNSLQRGLGIR